LIPVVLEALEEISLRIEFTNEEGYFDAIINAVENDNLKLLVEFTLKAYYTQVKKFVSS
jgi:hypothetical protein